MDEIESSVTATGGGPQAGGSPDAAQTPTQTPSQMPSQIAASQGRYSELPSEVIDAFVSGSTGALGQVYDRYSRPVWSIVTKVLGGSPLVEDTVQEVFLRAWRAADRFDPNRSLAPWLFTIARRTAIDVLRKEARPTRGDHEPEVDVGVNPPDFADMWCIWEVRDAIDLLPADEAAVVRLSYLDGYTHHEIATLLDVPVGTVKSRSHRAHRKLGARLRHLEGEVAQSQTGSSQSYDPQTGGE